MYEDRLTQLDVLFIRNFRVAGAQIQGVFDIYDALNGSAVLSQNGRFGASWRTPKSVLDARIFKVGVDVSF